MSLAYQPLYCFIFHAYGFAHPHQVIPHQQIKKELLVQIGQVMGFADCLPGQLHQFMVGLKAFDQSVFVGADTLAHDRHPQRIGGADGRG